MRTRVSNVRWFIAVLLGIGIVINYLDTEPDFPKSGWHGWVYDWKLHVVSVVAAVWFPIAAVLTPANVA